MNEELKIIIKAVADEAKREIAKVKQELKGVKDEAEKANKASEAMKKIGKAAVIAATATAALGVAMEKLGKVAHDAHKGFSRLESSFVNAGSSAKQATKYYRDLYGVLGEHDRAIEAGQSFARITTDPGALNDYKDIVAGGVSQYGEGYNAEMLAENISETIAAAKVVGDLERVLVEAGISADGFNAALAQTTSLEEREILVRNVLNGVLGNAGRAYIAANQATIQYNQAQADLNIALSQASAYTTPFLTAITNLGTTLLTVLSPALATVAAYLTAFIQLIAEAIQWVGSFFGMFSSKTEGTTANVKGYQEAMRNYLNGLKNSFGGTNTEMDKTLNQINAVKKATMGFDELNIVSTPTSASVPSLGGGGGGGGSIPTIPEAPNPEDYGIGNTDLGFESIKEDIEKAKEKIKSLLPLIAMVGTAFAAWKITSLIKQLKTITGGYKTILKLGKEVVDREFGDGTFDKINGKIDDLKTKIMGVVGIVLIVAGALALVYGWTDAWVNGLDWGNFAAIMGGIALIVTGITLKFGSTAGAISLVVGGIAMLVIGIKDLIENGYSMEAVIMVAVGAIAVLVGIIWAFNASLLASPITWIIVAIMALVAVFVILWNECEGFRNFWIGLWDGIVIAFKATVQFFKDMGKAIAQFLVDAWNITKKAWSAATQWFKGIWQGIKDAFSNCQKWFSDIFTGAWNAVKKAFSAVGSFFTGIWNDIKRIFSTIGSAIGDAVSKAFSNAINWVLEKAIGIINGFINAINSAITLINKIPGVNITKLNTLDVPKLAKGGIVDSATLAVIGERGKEAVMPLENNTQWMDVLADKISSRNSGPSKIVLMLDGRELGWANIHSINSITEQTGQLQLALY